MIFNGSCVAICTPFNEGGINFDTFERLVEFQIENKTDAIVVCGTTGEPSTMTGGEKKSAVEFVVRTVAGRVPVIAGVGGNNTADAAKNARHAEDAGANGILAVTPYYNKCNKDGLTGHFAAIADASSLPLIVYNVPARTNVNVTPEMFARLCEHKNIAAIKEACADMCQIVELARLIAGRADIYSGTDEITVPIMSLGGAGVISVMANIAPRYMHDMVKSYIGGDTKTAARMQLDANPLISALFCEVNPIPAKTALGLMGYDMGEFRLPLAPMDEANLSVLKREMRAFNLID